MSYVRQPTTIAVNTEATILTADPLNALDIFAITVANTSVTDVSVTIREATGGAAVWKWAVKAGTTFGFMRPHGEAARQSLKNNNWTAQVSAAVSSIEITVEANSRPA